MSEKTEGAVRLYKHIHKLDVTQAEYAKTLAVTQGMLSRWLSGAQTPSRLSAEAIQRVTGIPASAWAMPAKERRA